MEKLKSKKYWFQMLKKIDIVLVWLSAARRMEDLFFGQLKFGEMDTKITRLKIIAVFVFFCLAIKGELLSGQDYKNLAPVVKNGNWIQPAQGKRAQPVWGHVNGIRVGIAPMPGPRGLLRIYAPYLGHKEGKMINFIAFEPIRAGKTERGFSELEMSKLDNVRGKRFWSANDSVCSGALPEIYPASGVVRKINSEETLTVFIFSELFDNGARVYARLRFYEYRPFEVELTTNVCEDSKELDSFILTATMGNFARLRTLYLADSTKTSLELWPGYRDVHFTLHDSTSVDEMIKDKSGGVYFIAAPDEENPQIANYSPDTREHWKYYGETATQYWYCPRPDSQLMGLVNGRYTYWASKSPIPEGISFENFELKTPLKNGEKLIFGISPLQPSEFIQSIKADE